MRSTQLVSDLEVGLCAERNPVVTVYGGHHDSSRPPPPSSRTRQRIPTLPGLGDDDDARATLPRFDASGVDELLEQSLGAPGEPSATATGVFPLVRRLGAAEAAREDSARVDPRRPVVLLDGVDESRARAYRREAERITAAWASARSEPRRGVLAFFDAIRDALRQLATPRWEPAR